MSDDYEGFFDRMVDAEFVELDDSSAEDAVKDFVADENQATDSLINSVNEIKLSEDAQDFINSVRKKTSYDLRPEDLERNPSMDSKTFVPTTQGRVPLEEISGVFEHPITNVVTVMGKDGIIGALKE